MNWKLIQDSRRLGPECICEIERTLKDILGPDIFLILAKYENSGHPWHEAACELCNNKIIDHFQNHMKSFYATAGEFIYFYKIRYNKRQKAIAKRRIRSKEEALSIIFEHRIGLNFIWMRFYDVKMTNIDGAHHDILLTKDDYVIGVECSIKIKGRDFGTILRKMEEKSKTLSDEMANFLAIHIADKNFNELFGTSEKISAFGRRLQGKFKANSFLNKINIVLFSTIEYKNVGFQNINSSFSVPDDFPITGQEIS